MKPLQWLGIIVIVVGVGGGMLWLLWPQLRPPVIAEATAGPYQVRLKGAPPKVGISPMTVEISGSAGETPTPEWVRFEPHMPQLGLAATAVEAAPAGTEDYRADVDLSAPGTWEITVRIGAGTQSYDAILRVTAKR
jgi:YtkA-like